MSAEQLLREFGRLVDGPTVVARTRRLVLDLAVRGLLVPQTAEEGTADSLIESILRVPREVPLRPAYRSLVDQSVAAPPFEIPAAWAWTRLGRVSDHIQRGKSPTYSANGGPLVVSQKCVRWEGLDIAPARAITPASLATYEPSRFLRDQDLLWNSTGTGTIGRVSLVEAPSEKLVCDSHVTVVRCSRLNAEYVRCWFRSDHVFGRIEGDASGSTNQVELTLQMALGMPIPIPPLAEQHRIVAKVEELMVLCEELEALQTEREVRRERLRATALRNIVAPVESKPSIRFFLSHSQRMITKPEHVAAVRQAILDLAVQGRLVPQNLRDEPAAALLQSDGGARGRVEPVATDVPTPPGWVRTEMRRLTVLVTSGSRGWAEYYSPTGAKFIRAQNIRLGHLLLGDLAHVTVPKTSEGTRTRVQIGDVLIVITGAGVTNAGLLQADLDDAYVSQHVGLVRLRNPQIGPWVLLCLMARAGARDELLARAYGSGKPGLNLDNIRTLEIPLAPLAEQARIVTKVDELMVICDELERGLTAQQTERALLLDALLQDALKDAAPASELEPLAAL